ncbi:MAG: dihydrolipoyl dehydrogenase [Sulfurospirillum sp.]
MMYDVVVIGGGPGGEKCSASLTKAGKKVCLIEKKKSHIGGTCLNEGCIPAKLYLESVGCLGKKKHLESLGFSMKDTMFELNTLKDKKTTLLNQIRKGATASITKAGVDILFGEARFIGENSVQVGEQIIKADKFVIATGSIHRPHPLLEIDKKQIISSDEVFELEKIPESILIVGGGAIGCEFATFFNSLGVNVHIAEFTPNLVPAEDEDVAKTLERELKRKGIKVTTNANVTNYTKNENSVMIDMQTSRGAVQDSYELVLVSIGRAPNTKNLGLKNANIKNDRGFIIVDENLTTANPNIYALGDVIPTPALAHMAYHEAKVVANNILNTIKKEPSKTIPFVTFCNPQVASVGLNEKTLKKSDIDYEVKKQFFKSSSKAKIKGDDGGFIKLLCEENSGVILGGAIIGQEATELIHLLLIAVNQSLTIDNLKDMVFAHPTLSESIGEMLQ